MSTLFRNLALTGATGLIMAGSAFAGPTPQTTTFLVSAQVAKSCTVTATPLAFGAYDPLAGAATPGTSTVTVTCTKNTATTTALNGGVNGSLAAGRKMLDSVSGNSLNYTLFTTAGGPTVCGDGTSGTVTQAFTITSLLAPKVWTVFGSIPAGQDVALSASNTYQDTITVNVTF